MDDVKFVPKVVGPLEELKYIDLVSFHRLGQEARANTAKIKAKIDLLGEQGYGKRLEGVSAWRNSPLNELYLAMGNESIGTGEPIDAIIEKRKKAKKDFLSAAEFDAIMDLNKSLRY